MKKFVLLLFFVSVSTLQADSIISLSLEEGYNNNLFNDSLAYDASYTRVVSDLLVYPTEILEIDLFGDYARYAEISSLSNFNGGVSLTLIPTDIYMRSQIYINSTFSFLKYGDQFSVYDNRSISASLSWNYAISNKFKSKTGTGISDVSYTSTSSVKDRLYYLYAGFNSTIFKNNSIDGEIAYYNKKFITDDSFNSDNSYIDINGRFSRPLSASAGLKISYLNRSLQDKSDTYMPGFTIDYLSPWSSLWGGNEIEISIRKIFPKQFVFRSSFIYAEKEYINQLELDPLYPDELRYLINQRTDISNSYLISIEKEFSADDKIITPRISANFLNNNSSTLLYNYDKFTIRCSINVSF